MFFFPTFALSKQNVVSVAQQVEHIPFKDGVLGSNPSWNTEKSHQVRWLFYFHKILNMIARLFGAIEKNFNNSNQIIFIRLYL